MIPLLYEAPKIIKLIEAEGGMVSAGRNFGLAGDSGAQREHYKSLQDE